MGPEHPKHGLAGVGVGVGIGALKAESYKDTPLFDSRHNIKLRSPRGR